MLGRLSVVIGENDTGKTRFLDGVARALSGLRPDCVSPEARTLVEVLETIASWHEGEQTVRTATNAAKYMEELSLL